jgi:hypothetical protein
MRGHPAYYLARPLISIILSAFLAVGEVGVANAAPQQGVTIRPVSGDGMELVVGSTTTKDVIVEIVDSAGKPLAGVPVTFVFPGAGRTGGTTDLNQYLSTAVSDDQGRASVHVKPSGPVGSWNLRVTAGSASASLAITNVTEASRSKEPETPVSAGAPAGTAAPVPGTASSTPPPKKSHLMLILLIVAVAAGGGIAAALAGKKGSGTTTTAVQPVSSTTTVSISLGSGSFGTSPPSH